MLNLRKSIIQKQEETEELLRNYLRNIKKQLIHQCSSEEQSQLLEKLDGCITTGINASMEDNNNDILKDNSYYILYFQMRREQYQILVHMNSYLKDISVTAGEAPTLFDFTEQLANELNELNPANELLTKAKEVEEYYRMAPLPKTREEFQNKFIMLRYFSDIISFIEIKQRFSNLHFA